MTVKEEIQLRLSGVTSAEIKDMKEREKLEETPPVGETKETPPVGEAKETPPAGETKETPPVGETKETPPADNVSRETLERLNALEEEKKKLETQLAKLQEDYTHQDNSSNVDTRNDFDKGVEIFKNAF